MTVSIVVATFGEASWQRLARQRAIPSAAGQGAFEIIPVHLDGPSGTLANARNLGAWKANGDWLCFLDADDELAPGYLQAMTAALPEADALLVPAVQYVHLRRTTEPVVLNDGRPLTEINRAVIGTLIQRKLFLDLGGFNDLPALEDWELWLRAERAGARLVDVPDAVYRVHVQRRSRNADQSLYWDIRREFEAAA